MTEEKIDIVSAACNDMHDINKVLQLILRSFGKLLNNCNLEDILLQKDQVMIKKL
jgi:hypothetical protein